MRVVVCTVVHHPADARIYFRQIRALLDRPEVARDLGPREDDAAADKDDDKDGA